MFGAMLYKLSARLTIRQITFSQNHDQKTLNRVAFKCAYHDRKR